MKKIGLLLFFAVFACSLSAQNRLSVFIGNANRYASVDLSDFRRRLCVEYDISAESLNDYYRRCGRDWGHVGLALEIARTSGRSMRDICDYYRRYKSEGWGRILIELGIGPESSYCAPFYDRVHCHSDYWHEHYDSYCKRHGKYLRTSTGIRNTRNTGSGNTGDIMTMITTMTRMMTIEWPVIIPCKSLYV